MSDLTANTVRFEFRNQVSAHAVVEPQELGCWTDCCNSISCVTRNWYIREESARSVEEANRKLSFGFVEPLTNHVQLATFHILPGVPAKQVVHFVSSLQKFRHENLCSMKSRIYMKMFQRFRGPHHFKFRGGRGPHFGATLDKDVPNEGKKV